MGKKKNEVVDEVKVEEVVKVDTEVKTEVESTAEATPATTETATEPTTAEAEKVEAEETESVTAKPTAESATTATETAESNGEAEDEGTDESVLKTTLILALQPNKGGYARKFAYGFSDLGNSRSSTGAIIIRSETIENEFEQVEIDGIGLKGDLFQRKDGRAIEEWLKSIEGMENDYLCPFKDGSHIAMTDPNKLRKDGMTYKLGQTAAFKRYSQQMDNQQKEAHRKMTQDGKFIPPKVIANAKALIQGALISGGDYLLVAKQQADLLSEKYDRDPLDELTLLLSGIRKEIR